MDSTLLKEEALKLSPFERAQLINALLESLDAPNQDEIDQAWLDESKDRLQAYRQSEVEAVDGETALAGLRAKLSQRHLRQRPSAGRKSPEPEKKMKCERMGDFYQSYQCG